MHASFAELLQTQQAQGGAVGAFTCYNFETAIAVIQAAKARQCGVIFLISEKSFALDYGPALVAGLRAIAEQAPVPICLQLDHVSDLGLIEAAFKAGVGAVMADGSHLPFEENIAFSREAVAIARRYGGAVEAELGRIEGNEDQALAVQSGALTDPEQAAYFVARVQPDCLAVSIGNVHGIYRLPPVLDWARLTQVRQAIPTPLSLHGASGLSDQDLEQAIARGIVKINVNTELRASYFEVIEQQLESARTTLNLLSLQRRLIEGQSQIVAARLQVYQRALPDR